MFTGGLQVGGRGGGGEPLAGRQPCGWTSPHDGEAARGLSVERLGRRAGSSTEREGAPDTWGGPQSPNVVPERPVCRAAGGCWHGGPAEAWSRAGAGPLLRAVLSDAVAVTLVCVPAEARYGMARRRGFLEGSPGEGAGGDPGDTQRAGPEGGGAQLTAGGRVCGAGAGSDTPSEGRSGWIGRVREAAMHRVSTGSRP